MSGFLTPVYRICEDGSRDGNFDLSECELVTKDQESTKMWVNCDTPREVAP